MSLTSNKSKVESLVNSLAEHVPPELLGRMIVFGSAAIALRDVDLRREIGDLDIFVSKEDYRFIKANLPIVEKEKKPGVFSLEFGDMEDIEIYKTFPGVTYEETSQNASLLSSTKNMLVASREDLCKWKIAQGREKDLQDLEIMRS